MSYLHAIVLRQCSENVCVFRQVILRKRRHDAARIGNRYSEFDALADRQLPADPVVLYKSSFIRINDHVHTKAAFVEATLGLKLVQSIQTCSC